jgi:hypothetical protein
MHSNHFTSTLDQCEGLLDGIALDPSSARSGQLLVSYILVSIGNLSVGRPPETVLRSGYLQWTSSPSQMLPSSE